MKKSKFITLTLVIAVMLMGAGYAAWQETLTINNTVSTGELNIEFKDNFFYPFFMAYDNQLLHRDYFGYDQVNQDEAKDIVTMTVSDMYPGATFSYELRADNVGSIPATVESVVVDLSTTNDLFDQTMKVSGEILHRRPGRLFSVNRVALRDVSLSNLQNYLNTRMTGWDIKLGDYIVFDLPDEEEDPNVKNELAQLVPGYSSETSHCLFFYLPLSAGNELQSETLPQQQFSIKFNFKQFNK